MKQRARFCREEIRHPVGNTPAWEKFLKVIEVSPKPKK